MATSWHQGHHDMVSPSVAATPSSGPKLSKWVNLSHFWDLVGNDSNMNSAISPYDGLKSCGTWHNKHATTSTPFTFGQKQCCYAITNTQVCVAGWGSASWLGFLSLHSEYTWVLMKVESSTNTGRRHYLQYLSSCITGWHKKIY